MEQYLHWGDYVIMTIFLSISFAIGIYHSLTGDKQRTTTEFIMANRNLSVIPTAISMLMSYISAILIIGHTAEIYDYGTMFVFWIALADIVGGIFLVLVVIPWIFPLQLVSMYDVRITSTFGLICFYQSKYSCILTWQITSKTIPWDYDGFFQMLQ